MAHPAAPGPGSSRLRRVYESAPLAAWVGALAGVVAAVVAIVALPGTPGSAEGTAAPTGRVASASPSGTGAADAAPGPRCADPGTGTVLDCTLPAAWLAVPAGTCTLESVLAVWGVDPDLTALLVDVRAGSGQCWAAPSSAARAGGAVTLDLARISGASLPAAMRECARGARGETTVSCRSPHELEWVGGWRPATTGDATAECRTLGRRYTDNALSEAAGRIELVVVQGKRPDGALVHRCALTVRGATLTGTLYGVAEGSLPTNGT